MSLLPFLRVLSLENLSLPKLPLPLWDVCIILPANKPLVSCAPRWVPYLRCNHQTWWPHISQAHEDEKPNMDGVANLPCVMKRSPFYALLRHGYKCPERVRVEPRVTLGLGTSLLKTGYCCYKIMEWAYLVSVVQGDIFFCLCHLLYDCLWRASYWGLTLDQ